MTHYSLDEALWYEMRDITHLQARRVTKWLRSPEGREVVARELGLYTAKELNDAVTEEAVKAW